MKLLYKMAVSLVWLAGVALLSFAAFHHTRPLSETQALTLGVIAFGSAVSMFSFAAGAQPGHWARACTVIAVTFMAFAEAYKLSFDGLPWVSTLIMAVGVATVFWLLLRFGKQFRSEFRQKGRVDYFHIYFD